MNPETAPARTLEQRMSALAEANRIRSGKSKLKREIKARRLSAIDALSDPLSAYLRLDELILAIPKMGRVKCAKLLAREVELAPSKRIGSLSPRQIEVLRRALEGRA